MGDVRLQTPRVKVIREGYDDLDEIQTTNADLVLWDRTRYRHKWPTLQDAPILWMTFIAWAAARRTGAIAPDYKYETWEIDVLEVRVLDDDEEDEEGRPTNAGLDLD
jgi:hypothetical protein